MSEEFLSSHPHCLLAYRWITSWIHLLYFLSDQSVELRDYHEFFSHAHTPERIMTDFPECIRHFYHYFVTLENIDHMTNRRWQNLTASYGHTLPMLSLVQKMSERDKEIFRTFTLDVYMSVADPYVVTEVGILPTPEEEFWFSNLTKSTSS
jgi:hypothetical protein